MATDQVPENGKNAVQEITITVNNKPVKMTKGKHTGLEVKDAAIAAQLPVTRDFVLTELHGKSEPRKTIGDADSVNIHEGSEFALVADDDDS